MLLFWIKSQLGEVLFIKKLVTSFFSRLKMSLAAWVYFCFYLLFHWGDVVEKVFSKAVCLKKKKKKKDVWLGELL